MATRLLSLAPAGCMVHCVCDHVTVVCDVTNQVSVNWSIVHWVDVPHKHTMSTSLRLSEKLDPAPPGQAGKKKKPVKKALEEEEFTDVS